MPHEWSGNTSFEQSNQNQTLTNSAELLRDMILDAVKESTPALQLTTHSKRWWTPQLKISRTQMNRASSKQWKKTPP